jgi:hypothetical protein
VSYLLAVLGLGAACALWVLVQRGSGSLGEAPCGDSAPDCSDCAIREAGCPTPRLGDAPGAPDAG